MKTVSPRMIVFSKEQYEIMQKALEYYRRYLARKYSDNDEIRMIAHKLKRILDG